MKEENSGAQWDREPKDFRAELGFNREEETTKQATSRK
jgi:hypothetical protein